MIGSKVSHYRILEKLGEGGMGVVYKAVDERLNRFVAIKFLGPSVERSTQGKDRLIREAQAASCINHPNVCTIHECGELDGNVFIVMEFVEGVSLSRAIADDSNGVTGRIQGNLQRALGVAIQIAEGLKKAHEKNVIHRDIKPDNVMVTSEGLVKIMDFGLARISGQAGNTASSSTVGTVAYMSPEQAQGLLLDQRSDIFSFGSVLYEMVCGKAPFRGEHLAAILYEVVNCDPMPLKKVCEGVDEELDRIVLKCLAKVPDERYQDMAEVLIDLRAYVPSTQFVTCASRGSHQQTSSSGTGRARPKRMQDLSRRRLVALLVAAVFLTALMVALAMFWNRWRFSDTGLVSLHSDPIGVEIEMNGKVIGTTPILDFRTEAGVVSIRAVCEGYRTFDTTFELIGGTSTAFVIRPRTLEATNAERPGQGFKNPRNEAANGTKDALTTKETPKNERPGEPFETAQALAEYLSGTLVSEQKHVPGKVLLEPFTYRGTEIASEFSMLLKTEMELSFGTLAQWSLVRPEGVSFAGGGDIGDDDQPWGMVCGWYWQSGSIVNCVAQLRRPNSNEVLCTVRGSLQGTELDRLGVATQPSNYPKVINYLASASTTSAVEKDLKLNLWTNRGKHNLLFQAGDTLQVSVRVNAPCWVRVMYIQANNEKILLTPDLQISSDQVNRDLLAKKVVCGPPFGAEIIQAFASTGALEGVRLAKRSDGLLVVAEDIQKAVAKTRGIYQPVPGLHRAEAVVVLTTIEKLQPRREPDPY